MKSDRTLTAGLCLALACPLVVVLKKTKYICLAHTDSLAVYLATHTSVCSFMRPSFRDFMFTRVVRGVSLFEVKCWRKWVSAPPALCQAVALQNNTFNVNRWPTDIIGFFHKYVNKRIFNHALYQKLKD